MLRPRKFKELETKLGHRFKDPGLLERALTHASVRGGKIARFDNERLEFIGDRVLVQHIEEKEQVRGGIIIPDSAKEKPQEAKVIALGTGKRDENGKVTPFEVKVGDKVLISKYGGTEVKIDDQKYTLVREDDILGVIG